MICLSRMCGAISHGAELRDRSSLQQTAKEKIGLLTDRERQVLEQLVAGQPNKGIAYELDISPRTVEIHRASLMDKMQARSLSDVVRLAIAAGFGRAE